MQFIQNFDEISAKYKVALCDIWGVLHGGGMVFPQAARALQNFQKNGGKVILVSNAPYLGPTAQRYLENKGLGPQGYTAVITAGDITREALIEGGLGKQCYLIGSQRDKQLLAGTSVEEVELEKAEFILAAGIEKHPEAYRPMLEQMQKKNLKLVCANPDKVVRIGETLFPCAGALAELYEKMGGEVVYFGKPHAAIYAKAFSLEADTSRNAYIAVGDSLSTDIKGACSEKLDSLFIASGIHSNDCLEEATLKLEMEDKQIDVGRTQSFVAQSPFQPQYAMAKFG